LKVLAVNSSPRGKNSNTDRILQPFLEGAREAGAGTETIYLENKKINHCTACFTCWAKTPGVCIQKDDMSELLEKVIQAEVIVYATPVYAFTVSGLMKDFMDRLIPLLNPQVIKRHGHYTHPMRHEGAWPKKAVLISNCGFPERHNFLGLVETFRLFTSSGYDSELVTTILCASGELLKMPKLRNWYIDASRSAGRELIEQGHISPETQAVLDQLLVDPEVYNRIANDYWDKVIANQPKP